MSTAPQELMNVAIGKPVTDPVLGPDGATIWTLDLLAAYPVRSVELADLDGRVVVAGWHDQTGWRRMDGWQGYGPALPLRYLRLTAPQQAKPVAEALLRGWRPAVLLDIKAAIQAEQAVDNIPIKAPTKAGEQPELAAVVLGTSNSVNRGYVDGLPAAGITLRRNVSLGSIHMILTGYRLPFLEGIDARLLILDLHVVDYRAARLGFDLSGIAGQILDHVACWCAENDMIPVYLMMPARFGYLSPDRDMVARYADACRNHGIPWFDGYRFLDRLAALWGREPLSLIPDEAHLNRLAARCLAAVMGQQIRKKLGRYLTGPIPKAPVTCGSFSHIGLADWAADKEVIERRTSLIVERLVRMTEGDEITVTAPPGAEVVGLVLNMAHTNASLRITGSSSLTKRLDNRFWRPDIAMWMVAWTIMNPVKVGPDGRLRLACLSSRDADASVEDNDHRMGWQAAAQDHPPQIEIQGIILRHAPTQRHRIILPPDHLDLAKGLNIEMLTRAAQPEDQTG